VNFDTLRSQFTTGLAGAGLKKKRRMQSTTLLDDLHSITQAQTASKQRSIFKSIANIVPRSSTMEPEGAFALGGRANQGSGEFSAFSGLDVFNEGIELTELEAALHINDDEQRFRAALKVAPNGELQEDGCMPSDAGTPTANDHRSSGNGGLRRSNLLAALPPVVSKKPMPTAVMFSASDNAPQMASFGRSGGGVGVQPLPGSDGLALLAVAVAHPSSGLGASRHPAALAAAPPLPPTPPLGGSEVGEHADSDGRPYFENKRSRATAWTRAEVEDKSPPTEAAAASTARPEEAAAGTDAAPAAAAATGAVINRASVVPAAAGGFARPSTSVSGQFGGLNKKANKREVAWDTQRMIGPLAELPPEEGVSAAIGDFDL
jgi:hypothetical protein